MKQEENTLIDLPLHTKGYIEKINFPGNIKRRLLDLGLIENTAITPILVSPSGDPRAFVVRNTLLAIRKEDATLIKIHF